MIRFAYITDNVDLAVTNESEHLDALVEDFKAFLAHVGFHHDSIARITLAPEKDRMSLTQIDWIDG